MSLTNEERATAPAARVAPLRVLRDVDDTEHLLVHEVYASVQGESTWAGVPCTFVRTTACHLRCTYCDTAHAFEHGSVRAVRDVIEEVTARGIPLVEVTGGEPLLQRGTQTLLTRLLDLGHTVLVETSGAVSLAGFDRRARFIVDVKTPGSGEDARVRWDILPTLQPAHDEVKFVLTSADDYAWAADVVRREVIPRGVTTLFSPAFGGGADLQAASLAERIVADRLPVRFQLQLHKVLWGDRPGV